MYDSQYYEQQWQRQQHHIQCYSPWAPRDSHSLPFPPMYNIDASCFHFCHSLMEMWLRRRDSRYSRYATRQNRRCDRQWATGNDWWCSFLPVYFRVGFAGLKALLLPPYHPLMHVNSSFQPVVLTSRWLQRYLPGAPVFFDSHRRILICEMNER